MQIIYFLVYYFNIVFLIVAGYLVIVVNVFTFMCKYFFIEKNDAAIVRRNNIVWKGPCRYCLCY